MARQTQGALGLSNRLRRTVGLVWNVAQGAPRRVRAELAVRAERRRHALRTQGSRQRYQIRDDS
jgi:hypothetical protein